MPRRSLFLAALAAVLVLAQSALADPLPKGFVYLRDVDPTIVQDMRYAGSHNFLGRPVAGYEAPECILCSEAAKALKDIQAELAPMGLGLMVYDCYRPQRAVDDFVSWSEAIADQATKEEFYPRVNKKDFFELGYVAKKSSHSRGSTVDLTVIPLNAQAKQSYTPGQKLVPCFADYDARFKDRSIDMGTGFDCMDELSHSQSPLVSAQAKANRALLRGLMLKNGFAPYEYEWWHFTLKKERHPKTIFDFPVTGKE